MIDDNIPPEDLRAEAAALHTPAERLRELARRPALAPIVASNPGAGADLLRELGSIDDHTPFATFAARVPVARVAAHQLLAGGNPTLAAVASNPNTPVETLLRLAGAYPEQFCANPALPLLLLENPNLLAEMPPARLRGLLRYANVPRDFLEWVSPTQVRWLPAKPACM
jgi:hypothetical protein